MDNPYQPPQQSAQPRQPAVDGRETSRRPSVLILSFVAAVVLLVASCVLGYLGLAMGLAQVGGPGMVLVEVLFNTSVVLTLVSISCFLVSGINRVVQWHRSRKP